MTTSFSVPGSHVLSLRVVDKHGAEHNHVHTETVSVFPLANPGAPVSSFTFHPVPPIAGQPVSFYSTATDADSPIAAQRWDLDGNGSYGDALGPTAARTFALPGSYRVGLQVEDTTGMVAVVVGTLVVLEPSAAVAFGGNPRPIFPSPVVRLSGTITKKGIRVHRLTIDAPPGSRTAVRCRGRDCPFRWRRYTHRPTIPARVVRVRRLDGRLLRSGARLQVFVTRAGAIGRYTSFSIRRRKPPARRDRCLVSISTRPVVCPSSE